MKTCCLCGKDESLNTKTDFVREVIFDSKTKKITSTRIWGLKLTDTEKLVSGSNIICYNTTNCKQRRSARLSTSRKGNSKFSIPKEIQSLRDNNAMALYNGKKAGLSINWMSSMAGITAEYAKEEIRRITKKINLL